MKLAYDVYLPSERTEYNSLSPIILLHGKLESRKTWNKLAPEIAKRTCRKLYAIDLRNHGDSPWSNDMNMGSVVSDLEEFMNDLHIHKTILIGHSLGGRTCLAFALKKPATIEKLIIEDMDTKSFVSLRNQIVLRTFDLLRESLKAVPPNATEKEAKESIFAFIREKLPATQPKLKERGIFDIDAVPIKKEGDRYIWQANLDFLEDDLMSSNVNEELSGVCTADSLFLYGTKSFINVKGDEDIFRFFPRSTKVPIEGAGHLLHQVYPEEFLKQTIDFILK